MFEFNTMFSIVSTIITISSILIFAFVFYTIFKSFFNHRDIGKKIKEISDLSLDKLKEQLEEDNYEYKIMKCPNCGASLEDDLKVCSYCGSKLTKVKRK